MRRILLGIAWLLLSSVIWGCHPKPSSNSNTSPSTINTPLTPIASFSDKTRESGLAFQQSHGGCGQRYFVEQVAAGATVLDANGDGYMDIYFPQPKPLGICEQKGVPRQHQRLYLNDKHGHFVLSPNAFGNTDTDYGIAAAAGDFDNDGHTDIYVCCYGKNTLYHNRGDGTFEDITLKSGTGLKGFSTGAVWFDADGDGRLDLFVLRYCEWKVDSDIQCRGPHGEPDVCSPNTYTASTNVLYHNNGNGTFSEITQRAGVALEHRRSLGVAAADFDGDGKLDLFVANDLGPNSLLHNKGDGTFEEMSMIQGVAFGITGTEQANMGVTVGDFDEDGDLDILVTTFQNEPYALYRNEGHYFLNVSGETGIAEATTPYLGFGTGFFDSQNRGVLDIFCANGHVSPYAKAANGASSWKQANLLLLNGENHIFHNAPQSLPSDDVRVHRGAYFADFDNDGRIDILVTASDDRPTLLHNDSTPQHWLTLQLTNRQGCTTPVGVQCIATIAGKRQMRVLAGGESYAGDSDPRVHFGLGRIEQVDALEIHWLSGKVQTLSHIKADQILPIREPNS